MMKIVCVCKFCRHHEHEPVVEINFADNKMYWICPECKKENKIDISKDGETQQRLPKSTTLNRPRTRRI